MRNDGDAEKATEEPKTAVDWDGPEDAENPQNWPSIKRIYHTVIPTSIRFLCPFDSSVYSPGEMEVQAEFGVGRELSVLPFSFYLLGLSLGPIVAAPVSETFGRKITYISALPVCAAFTIGAGFSNNIASLVVCRLLAGIFASPGLSIGTGTIADVWPQHKRAPAMSSFITAIQFGPALGPLIGGAVPRWRSWRWTQWVILFGIALVIALMLGMSETYKTVILQKRAKRLGIKGPPRPSDGKTLLETAHFFATKTIIRPLHMMFTEPIVILMDLYIAFNFGLLNAFFGAFAYVFRTVYGFSLVPVGLTYLGQAVGTVIGLCVMLSVSVSLWPRQAEAARQKGQNKLPPEHRLLMAQIGAPLLPISLFWFGWTARSSIHWIAPVAAEAAFACGNILVFTTASLYLTDCYGALYGASAWSSNTFLRYLFAFAFPLFAVQMYEGLGVGWASSLLGLCELLLVPIPFLFHRYGDKLRQRSAYGSGE